MSSPNSTARRESPPRGPVKKRGRYSHPVPAEDFVRYELDEEDSSQDPDFEAEEPEDDEESVDERQELNSEARVADDELPHILYAGSEHGPELQYQSRGTLYDGLDGVDTGFDEGEPQFDIDDLDSSEDDDDDGEGAAFESEAHELGSPERHDLDPLEADEASDVGDVDDEELEEDAVEEGDVEQDEQDVDQEGPPDEYAQFLRGLLNPDNGVPTASETRPAGSDTVPPSWALDDDDDFDYLRESARVQDDPLEYRDDLHVSRKELLQLFFNNTEGGLRRQTRRSRARQASVGRDPSRAASVAQAAHTPSALTGRSLILPATSMPGTVASGERTGVSAGSDPGRPELPSQAVSGAFTASTAGLSAPALFTFREQLRVYVQILTTIYAENQKKVRVARPECHPDGSESGGIHSEDRPLAVASEAASRSGALIRDLLRNERVCAAYHEMVRNGMSKLRSYSKHQVGRDGTSDCNYKSSRTSVYDLPVLALLESFLKACSTAQPSTMPASVLQSLQPHFRADLTSALLLRLRGRQYSARGSSRPGWYPWTAQDDNLLAMTMAKYGSEFGGFSADLLPHRKEDDCQTRVKYLSSRRCPDNAVKRQVMFIAAPLNRDEVALVRRGLELYGQRGLNEEEVWRKIQSELLPKRDWSHLQRLWKWRETRRAHKARYRAKASQRKRALRQGAAQA